MAYSYKHCNLEWENEIPQTWSVEPLKHLVHKLSRPIEPCHEIVICANKGEVIFRGDKNPGLVSLTENGYQGVKPGDLLIHGMDTWHGAIAVSSIEGKCTSVVHVCDSKQNKRYLAYYLQSLAFRNVYKAFSNGVRQNTSDFRSWQKAGDIPVVVPSLAEQNRIASFLEEKCVEIDRAIASAEASIEEYQAYKKSVIFEAVTKGLEENAEMKDSGIEWVGDIPLNWMTERFKNLYQIVKRDFESDAELLSVYLNRGVILYSDSDGMQVHKPSNSLEKYQLVLPGDLVLNNQQAWRGSVGISAYRGIISPAYHVFEALDDERQDPEYMNLLFRYVLVPFFDLASRGVGTIQRCVSVSVFMNDALVPLPPLKEQRSCAAYVNDKCTEIDRLVSSKQGIIEELKAYKKSLIYEAVTGKREIPCR